MSLLTKINLWFKKLKPEDQKAALVRMFRATFAGDDAQIVLAAILDDLGLFREAGDPEAVALKNYATFFVRERLGIGNLAEMTQALMTVKPREK